MSLAAIYSRAKTGINAPLVTVEVHISNGLPGLAIVGLPEAAVKESKDRVRSALINSHFEFPTRRITVNLAPADLPKEGGRFDLPIALGILVASGQIPPAAIENYEFLGELALGGEIRPINGVLPAALSCNTSKRTLIIPVENSAEAALVDKLTVFAPSHLLSLTAHLLGKELLTLINKAAISVTRSYPDLADVQGQQQARRALEIAAAGKHNLLYIGSPGSGKTMLANRLPGLLPPLTNQKSIEVAALYSIAGIWRNEMWQQLPYRAPHHTASPTALVGGGSNPKPGEISLAHHGILFLDELPEFNRQVLEALRQPLESGEIIIARAREKLRLPAKFQFISAMNPCPCGYLGDPHHHCRCTPDKVERYRSRISGPLLDRIDMHVAVQPVPAKLLTHPEQPEDSKTIRERVITARGIQHSRQNCCNAELSGPQLERYCQLTDDDKDYLYQTLSRLNFSARAYHRILRVARTIADLANSVKVSRTHLAEAISYRNLDRNT
ncbi:MAG: magnesium chelatase family protein [Pseudomonadales bacterium]|jgi:magnesium chelatase family protein